jgi:hypothetical protein
MDPNAPGTATTEPVNENWFNALFSTAGATTVTERGPTGGYCKSVSKCVVPPQKKRKEKKKKRSFCKLDLAMAHSNALTH